MIQSSSIPPQTRTIVSVCESILPSSVGFVKTSESDVMPLAQHLKNGYLTGRPEAWHRSDERITRGLAPIVDPNVPLDDWERALAWMEILLVSGSTDECFAHWTRGWGRDDEVQRILKQLLERNPASLQCPVDAAIPVVNTGWPGSDELLDDLAEFNFENRQQDMESLTDSACANENQRMTTCGDSAVAAREQPFFIY